MRLIKPPTISKDTSEMEVNSNILLSWESLEETYSVSEPSERTLGLWNEGTFWDVDHYQVNYYNKPQQ